MTTQFDVAHDAYMRIPGATFGEMPDDAWIEKGDLTAFVSADGDGWIWSVWIHYSRLGDSDVVHDSVYTEDVGEVVDGIVEALS